MSTVPKLRFAGVSVTPGAERPCPVSAMLCVPLASISVTLPVRSPGVDGEKLTVIVQELRAASALLQVFDSGKSMLEDVMPVIASGTSPEFVSVMLRGELVVPTCCEAKVMLFVESVAVAGT